MDHPCHASCDILFFPRLNPLQKCIYGAGAFSCPGAGAVGDPGGAVGQAREPPHRGGGLRQHRRVRQAAPGRFPRVGVFNGGCFQLRLLFNVSDTSARVPPETFCFALFFWMLFSTLPGRYWRQLATLYIFFSHHCSVCRSPVLISSGLYF